MKKTLRCSDCGCELEDFYYVLPDGNIVCKDCFVEWAMLLLESDPALIASLIGISRVEVKS